MYISHMRSEGNRWLEAVDELIEIARGAGVPAEIYHLKAAGEAELGASSTAAVAKIEAARAAGLARSPPTCTPTPPAPPASTRRCRRGCRRAGSSLDRPAARLRRRARAWSQEMRPARDAWENLCLRRRLAEQDPARRLQDRGAEAADRQDPGRGGARCAARRPEETAMDLVIEDGSRVGTVYFLMSEDNVAQADRAALGELRLGRRRRRRPRACSSSRAPTRAPTATSRACSASTCATRR